MKKLLIVISVICMLCLLAADTPPALPSSFYGTVARGAKAGSTVSVFIGRNMVASSQTFLWEGKMVYSLDVPMGNVGTPIKDGTIAIFRVNGAIAGYAALYSGTNTNLNLIVRWGWFGR